MAEHLVSTQSQNWRKVYQHRSWFSKSGWIRWLPMWQTVIQRCLLQLCDWSWRNSPPWVVLALLVIILNHSGQTLLAMHLFWNVTPLPLLESLLGLTWKSNPTSDKKMASKPLNLMMLPSLSGDWQSFVHGAQLHWSS